MIYSNRSTDSKNSIAVSCPSCGGLNVRVFLVLQPRRKVVSSWGVALVERTIYVCGCCGVQFAGGSNYSESHTEDMYDRDYHDAMEGAGALGEELSGVKDQFRVRLGLIRGYVRSGNLLDVGCSTGAFLALAKEGGFSIFGLEPSGYACVASRERLGCDQTIIENSLVNASVLLSQKKFDVITLWDVIEHFSDMRNDIARLACQGSI